VAPNGSDANNGTADSPFATLTQAQHTMQQSTIKTTYLRAGTYSNVTLTLSSQDNGETWSYYPGDGYNSAVIDGGASGPNTGVDPISILGGSNITINGLKIQNFPDYAIGIHGGHGDTPQIFPADAANSDGVIISNNILTNGYATKNNGWFSGGVFVDGQVTNLVIANNVISNQYGSGISVAGYWAGPTSYNLTYTHSGLRIKNNIFLSVCMGTGDTGAIYLVDRASLSTNIQITNNFIRDYQSLPSLRNSNSPMRDVGIYLDEATQNVLVSGNVIANTANQFQGSAGTDNTHAIFLSSARNITISNNIVDLGNSGEIVDMGYLLYSTVAPNPVYPPMTGNQVSANIFIGNWSGGQRSWGGGNGPLAFPAWGNSPTAPSISGNLYFDYGTGTLSTTGNEFHDTNPITGIDPLISGETYALASNSPVFSALSFPPLNTSWGPPGYAIPLSGTAPSYMQ
jgi:hypothetical protein